VHRAGDTEAETGRKRPDVAVSTRSSIVVIHRQRAGRLEHSIYKCSAVADHHLPAVRGGLIVLAARTIFISLVRSHLSATLPGRQHRGQARWQVGHLYLFRRNVMRDKLD
jgi:hypothetical protein